MASTNFLGIDGRSERLAIDYMGDVLFLSQIHLERFIQHQKQMKILFKTHYSEEPSARVAQEVM